MNYLYTGKFPVRYPGPHQTHQSRTKNLIQYNHLFFPHKFRTRPATFSHFTRISLHADLTSRGSHFTRISLHADLTSRGSHADLTSRGSHADIPADIFTRTFPRTFPRKFLRTFLRGHSRGNSCGHFYADIFTRTFLRGHFLTSRVIFKKITNIYM